ncbi:nucleotidyl transferase AbiEii/AbiGii toxin family protein, partial [Synergistaceae bacterium OttesenSCG-928-D05]|nr:nucleotidyl transferase AbiEii/AbiGii toxin family protein [Synergistaceae bacterium OttesenSCG-928-D05]
MYLHDNDALFEGVLARASQSLGVDIELLEKDYYVTMLLREISKRIPYSVFKGGTSLSKCYQIIDRFSEDVDLGFSQKLTGSERKSVKYELLNITQSLGMELLNPGDLRSRRDYNAYMLRYRTKRPILGVRVDSVVKLETYIGTISYPTIAMPVCSVLTDYLMSENEMHAIEEFSLAPFSMTLQSLERTFIDKIFALCDYYLREEDRRNSRHLYDIYKLMPKVTFDASLKALAESVRVERCQLSVCPSALEGVDVVRLLCEITESDFYKRDYESLTTAL